MFEKEGRWEAFTRFLDDGRLCLSNNAAERALRGIATTVSYCTSSSNVRKQGLLVFHFDATRASVTRKLGHFLLSQVGRSYLVRRVRHNLLGRKHPLLDQPAERGRAGDVGPLADHDEVGLGGDGQGLEPRQPGVAGRLEPGPGRHP